MTKHQVTNARSTASPEVRGYPPRALERAELDPTKKLTEQIVIEKKEKEELEDLLSIDQFFSSEWYM
jgi:hypothetical protein